MPRSPRYHLVSLLRFTLPHLWVKMQSAPRGETRQACALCYNRKIKCIDDGDSCRACNEHQTECRPRVSRRQGRPRGQSKHVFRTHTGKMFF